MSTIKRMPKIPRMIRLFYSLPLLRREVKIITAIMPKRLPVMFKMLTAIASPTYGSV